MEKPKNFGIYIPSYKRADTITSHKLFEYYKVVVRESEFEEYAETIPKENLIPVEDGKINSVSKVWNWIIDNAEEEVICTPADDIVYMNYRLEFCEKVYDSELITAECERIAQLMIDLDIGYGCEDATNTPWNYDAEFTFKGTSGGICWINKNVYKARFNDDIGYCCDTDVVLQELLHNRIVLKPKYICMQAGTDTNKGGNSQKDRSSMIASFELMKKKWGKYFDYDLKSNKIYIRVAR